ncbi:MAG: solute carrier family 26 protein [Candidatus Thiodiazotropha endolucinida]|uniref:Solute carrier family 26 protein n=1 Tax=Candidatus Thiodiazotropha taylori TaxID=2792791 RepID=A0A9E4MVE1_9GAMM|nr:solute carrier family 26 protein [Candidatus Thiodiazotropha endolucinida]MCG7877667.1 solute carrier family 26 protein [Candidatus Thiodiazotropha taylori]MCG7883585.1 solute carrier family 26 protein [Candidatus Thiodiazotropha taylori]MCG7890082.1 solute carrier family 26 protein [Candidatus Thiodiazotropha taylori]MCG7949664.1 solute carrier family 26 protein [Candidatus Thiodiazotropha taylori]
MWEHIQSLMAGWKGAFIPFLSWIGEIKDRETVRADIIAGITVALVLVPQSMAYAQLAGLPVYYGLYASFLPPMVAAFFGSSRQLATGPVAVVSLMTAAALEPIATSPDTYLAYAVLLAFMVGIFQMFLGLFKLGVLVDFLSHPVVVGFTNAGALIIATSQLGKVFGVSVEREAHHYETVWNTVLAAMENTHGSTLGMAILAFAIMWGIRRYAPNFPGVLIAVVVTTLIAWLAGFNEAGGRVVGDIPKGLPALSLPVFDVKTVWQLIPAAITISLIGFMEAISIAKAMAARTRQRLNANQELIGQGLSNVVASVFSGYPVSGSFSRSAVNINAGAITGFSSIVTGLVVMITLIFLTPLLYHLPQATLAAVIIMAVINLIKIDPIIHAWKAQPHDAIVAVITFVLTLIFAPHLDKGIIIGVLLSLGLFLWRTMRPRFAQLSRYKDGTMRDIRVRHLPTSPVISVVRFDGSLYFASAGYFETKILGVVAANPELKYIILDGEAINQIDATGEEVLHHLWERLQAQGIHLVIARMKKQFMDTIRRTGLKDKMGDDTFYSRIGLALNYVWNQLGDSYDRENCPLRSPIGVGKE